MSTPDLDAIQGRSDDAMMHESLEPGSYAEIAWHSARDVPALLAYARGLEARLNELRALADVVDINDQQFGDGNGGSLTTEAIRAALTATDAS